MPKDLRPFRAHYAVCIVVVILYLIVVVIITIVIVPVAMYARLGWLLLRAPPGQPYDDCE